jgi:hypothetical protein
MSHIFLLYQSDVETLKALDDHFDKEGKSFIIPEDLLNKIIFLTSSYKFKDCKEFARKNITPDFKEILYDGSVNDLHTIYRSEDEAYWVLRIPINKLIINRLASKNISKKDTFLVFHQDVLIGVVNSKVQIFSLIEKFCDEELSNEYFTINVNEIREIVCGKKTFKVSKV